MSETIYDLLANSFYVLSRQSFSMVGWELLQCLDFFVYFILLKDEGRLGRLLLVLF